MLHFFVVLSLFSLGSGEEGARLLASKSLLNRYAVEGRDLTLQYNIYNVGSSAALEVELSDDSFPPEDFGIVSGMLNVKWDRIAPASNVSHTVVLRPLKAGYFNFTSASVSYLAQEGGQVVVGYTSAPGQGGILAQREFDRRFSPHYLDWAAFGVMTLPSIGIPLLLWYSSKRNHVRAEPSIQFTAHILEELSGAQQERMHGINGGGSWEHPSSKPSSHSGSNCMQTLEDHEALDFAC
ncbi:translocon-associated protein subunit beta [Lates japonicus]|uniref:Translocon-associated protein subunit beta n=1 Tax=Lates japonicus TaxID=270547 RepID=A0AAD3N0B4_LATJO|nr:translocon-associated protein subunit beta [Lates japonicus]